MHRSAPALCVACVWLAAVASAEQPPPEFYRATYDTFAASMTGPGHGCKGWHYRAVDCTQEPGKPPSCSVSVHMRWTCDVNPVRIGMYDFDDDGDVDLEDFAAFQRQWPNEEN